MVNFGIMLVVFVFSFLAGTILIRRVPPLLHTPLMSMTNAISGVTVLGAMAIFAADITVPGAILGAVAIMAAIFNVSGGFVITDRMLRMFTTKKRTPSPEDKHDR